MNVSNFDAKKIARKLVELSQKGTRNACLTALKPLLELADSCRREIRGELRKLGIDGMGQRGYNTGCDGLHLVTSASKNDGILFPPASNRESFRLVEV